MKVDTLVPEFARERFRQARDFAVLAHGEQQYGTQPYIVHLDAVAKIVAEQETDPGSFAAGQRAIIALLHDVVEDTDVTVELLEQAFGYHVAQQVDLISDKPGHNRKARKAAAMEVLNHLGPSNYDALIVKAADRLANVRAAAKDKPGLFKMYCYEHKAFTQAVRRVGLANAIWGQLHSLVYKEAKTRGL